MPEPLIIIGAGRSGTNALRDALCEVDAFHTWPCDEINYIWRHGNRAAPTDELRATHARPEVRRHIGRAFAGRQAVEPSAILVEKTCANSLRVEFVDAVVPNARFIHILRDGRDVAASAMDRWTAPLDLPYLARKARFVPRTDLPYYAVKYLSTRVARLRSEEDRLSWWGPKFEGMELLGPETPLVEVAARQWARCVELSIGQLSIVDPARIHTVKYSDLVGGAHGVIAGITSWLGLDLSESDITLAAATIRGGSVGKWKTALSTAEADLISPIVTPVLQSAGLEFP